MKRVIFTEAQLKSILGEAYNSTLNEIDNNINRSELVYSAPITSDENEYDCGPIGADPEAKALVNGNPLLRTSMGSSTLWPIAESKKKLNEVNRDFANRDIYIPKELLDKYDMPEVDSTLAHVKKDGFISPANAYKEISEFNKGLNTLPEDIIKWLQRQLNILEFTSEQRKALKKKRGETNVYQKAGGRRQSGNGKSHSKKNPLITYYK